MIVSFVDKKIPVSAPQPALQSPFASLNSVSLKAASEPPAGASVRPVEKKKPRIVLRREKARRGGKTVIVVSQLPTHLSTSEIENLLRTARKALGCGGTINDREIELQGDQPERVRAAFEKEGYQVGGI